MMHKELHRSTAIGNITRLGKRKTKKKIILVYLELFTFNLPINLEV
jgi:hypothetical protein